jgi:hypothetical protein
MFIDNTAPLGTNWSYGNAGSVTAIFTPSQNTNGIIVRTMQIGASILVVADTSAPSGYNDTSHRVIFYTNTPSVNAYMYPMIFPYPLLIPSGNGLWVCGGGPGDGYAITWDPVTA